MKKFTSTQARTYSRLGQRGAIFGLALPELAQENPNIVALTADLASLSGLDRYKSMFPDRFYNIGIAEQNMIGIAAGLSSECYLPIVTTYATFVTLRSCEQIRHFLGYMKMRMVVVGSGAGLVQAYSGATHYAIEDLSVMRSIPNLVVLSPADAGSALLAFEWAVGSDRPVYIRLTGALNCPIVYKEGFDWQLGKSNVLLEGKDIVIFATGVMVFTAMKAAIILSEHAISVKVVDMYSIKPIDRQEIEDDLDCKLMVSLEEHNVIGGLGGAISEVLSDYAHSPILLKLGIHDSYGLAGDYEYLLSQNRLMPDEVASDILTKYEHITG